MKNLVMDISEFKTGDALPVEIVEKKGIGHPDTICDEVAEAISSALRQYYVKEFGRVFHYNVDKVLLRAGSSRAEFGGGKLLAPLELYVCGRATSEISGRLAPMTELCEASAREWFRSHLRWIDPVRDVRVVNLIRPGSADLTHLFDWDGQGKIPRSNDTSIGVGFSPLSRLENAVLDVDDFLRSHALQADMPFVGEDIKIMAVRRNDKIRITLACAMVSRFILDLPDYLEKKTLLSQRVADQLRRSGLSNIEVRVNAADDIDAGSVYLTVTGTSAEAGDDGEVGRGNRANGLITPCRPMTTEAFAGKNSISHTGRIYQFLAQTIADQVSSQVKGLSSVECYLVSEIGAYINEPQLVNVRCLGNSERIDIRSVVQASENIVRDTLENIATMREVRRAVS